MPKVLITTVPFADKSRLPIEILERNGVDFFINPLGRKYKEEELAAVIHEYDAIIAGTEIISDKVISKAKKLKFISRVGIGLDSVDLISAEANDILVSYTPEAPAPAVAELTIGMILTLLRNVHVANSKMHVGEWHRYFGRRISHVTIGVIGAGRIGGRVINSLLALGASRILINDTNFPRHFQKSTALVKVEKERIYREADVITLHLPLKGNTKNMISYKELMMMKSDAILVNTSRGGIVNEFDLARVLREGHLSAAGVDVFVQEPYCGELKDIERCLLTSHMGSMSIDCRTRMELEATEEVVRFFQGEQLKGLVPKEDYEYRRIDL